jgi:hypothetical protein
VEYSAVDEDERGNIEFEFSVCNQAGKDFWNDISAEDQAEIEAQAGRDFKEYVRYENDEAAIARAENNRDFS